MKTRTLELAAAVAVGLVIGLAGYAIWLSSTGDDQTAATGTATTGTATTGTAATDTAQDPRDLVAAFERSRTVSFALTGVLRRERNDQVSTIQVRQARDGDQSLDEIGGIAIVSDGSELRHCELLNGTVLCTDPEPARTPAQEVAVFESLVLGAGATYQAYPSDPGEGTTCWALVANRAGTLGQYGDESVLCFDDGSGVLVGRTTRNGDTLETFTTTSLRLTVDPDDLRPTGA